MLMAGGAGLAALPLAALAQPFPTRSIRLIAGFPPGTAPDFVARAISPSLQEQLGVSVVVDNKAGAAGMIGAAEVLRAPADGYTLFLGNASDLSITPQTYRKPPFSPTRDFTAVAGVSSTDFVLVTNPATPASDLKNYLAWARDRKPLLLGTFGAGSIAHFGAASFAAALGLTVETVHYRSTGDAITGSINGDVHGVFITPALALPQVRAGKLKAIATTGGERSPALPEVATLKESGHPDVEFYAWFGIVAPAGTPAAVLDRLNAAVVAATQGADVRRRLEEAGMRVAGTSRNAFSELIASDTERWGKVIAATGFKTDD